MYGVGIVITYYIVSYTECVVVDVDVVNCDIVVLLLLSLLLLVLLFMLLLLLYRVMMSAVVVGVVFTSYVVRIVVDCYVAFVILLSIAVIDIVVNVLVDMICCVVVRVAKYTMHVARTSFVYIQYTHNRTVINHIRCTIYIIIIIRDITRIHISSSNINIHITIRIIMRNYHIINGHAHVPSHCL